MEKIDDRGWDKFSDRSTYYDHSEVMIGVGYYQLPKTSYLRVAKNQVKSHQCRVESGTCEYCQINDIAVRDGQHLRVDGFGELCEDCFKSLE